MVSTIKELGQFLGRKGVGVYESYGHSDVPGAADTGAAMAIAIFAYTKSREYPGSRMEIVIQTLSPTSTQEQVAQAANEISGIICQEMNREKYPLHHKVVAIIRDIVGVIVGIPA